MAAPRGRLPENQPDDEEDNEDGESDEDSSSSDDDSRTTSWGKIYQSLELVSQSGEHLNPRVVFHIANTAVLHGDSVNAVCFYSLGLNSVCKEYRRRSQHPDSDRMMGQETVDREMLKYAVEGCAQEVGKGCTKEVRVRLSKLVESLVECSDFLSLMDFGLLQAAASLHFSLKDKQKAFQLASRALDMNPRSLSLQEMLDNICCHLVERWHFVMLNDKARNRAYQQAIEACLAILGRKAVVCDVGCGTGLLSLIASQQANSGQVFAIEKSNSMCGVAHTVFSDNLAPAALDKVTLINKMSTKMSVPQDMPCRVDLLVTETFDAGVFGEGILPTLCHAWSHLIKNGATERGQVIPGAARLYMQAVESQAVRTETRFLGHFSGIETAGVHICGLAGLCGSDPYTAHDLKHLLGGYRTLSEPLQFMDVDFNNPEELSCLNKGRIRETELTISASGRLDAIAVWFALQLSDSVEIHTHTDCSSCWEQAIFPVHPIKVQMQPLSRGSSCDLNVKVGDKLQVAHGTVGSKLCVEVSAIFRPGEANTCCSPGVPRFLHDPDVWHRHSVYCLPHQEIKAVNNMSLLSAQYSRMIELLALVKKDNSEVDCIHLHDGFSPLCLQALKNGFCQASVWVHEQCQAALYQRLMTLNDIDACKLKVINNASAENAVPESGQGCDDTETSSPCGIRTPSRRAVVILCDLVDAQGRLTEGLHSQQQVIRHQISSYATKVISPHRVDVWGVLVDSEQLLRLSHVQSDENTLGFRIGDFVNKYATRNHQDVCLETLLHTKLSEPFQMFSVNMAQLFGIPEFNTTVDVGAPTVREGLQTETPRDVGLSASSLKQKKHEYQETQANHDVSTFSFKQGVNECLETGANHVLPMFSFKQEAVGCLGTPANLGLSKFALKQRTDESLEIHTELGDIAHVEEGDVTRRKGVNITHTVRIDIARRECVSIAHTEAGDKTPVQVFSIAYKNGGDIAHTEGVSIAHAEADDIADGEGVSISHTKGGDIAHIEGVSIAHTEGDAIAYREGVSIAHTEGGDIAHREGVSIAHTEGVDIAHREDASICARDFNCKQPDSVSHQPINSNGIETWGSSSLPETGVVTPQNMKRSSSHQLEGQNGTAGDQGSSPGKKRWKYSDGDEEHDAFLGCDSENEELCQSVHLKIPIVQPGNVAALFYWFDLHISPTCRISTCDPAHHWTQAAVMSTPSQTQFVRPGDTLNLFCQMNGSAVSFFIE